MAGGASGHDVGQIIMTDVEVPLEHPLTGQSVTLSGITVVTGITSKGGDSGSPMINLAHGAYAGMMIGGDKLPPDAPIDTPEPDTIYFIPWSNLQKALGIL